MSTSSLSYLKIFEGSPYVEADCRGGKVFKYKLDLKSSDPINRAASTVKALLTDHPDLIPTFSLESSLLLSEIEQNTYLIINGRAVCLAPQKLAPGSAQRELKDLGLSENLLKEPIKCSKGHPLEKSRVEFWIKREPKLCPYRSHPEEWSDPIEIDEETTDALAAYRSADNELEILKKIEDMERELLVSKSDRAIEKEEMERQIAIQNLQVASNRRALAEIQKEVDYPLALGEVIKITLRIGLTTERCIFFSKKWAYRYVKKYGVPYIIQEGQKEGASILMKCLSEAISKASPIRSTGKLLGKTMTRVMGENMASEASEELAKLALSNMSQKAIEEASEKAVEKAIEKGARKAGESYAKYIPGVSLTFGVGLAAYRWSSAKESSYRLYLQMCGEVVSGACAFLPSYGTAASFAIDLLLLGSDYQAYKDQPPSINVDIPLESAYQAFKIPPERRNELTKSEFDKVYRNRVDYHPDKITDGRDEETSDKNIEMLNVAKEAIYNDKQWS